MDKLQGSVYKLKIDTVENLENFIKSFTFINLFLRKEKLNLKKNCAKNGKEN